MFGDKVLIGNKSYVPISLEGTTTVTAWTTLYEATGRGFIRKAVIYPSSSYGVYLRITVDGVVTYNGYGGGNSYRIIGVVTEDLIDSSNAGNAVGGFTRVLNYSGTMDAISTYPYIGGSYYGCPVPIPIKFKNSIKIEAYVQSGYTGYYTISGGLE